MNYVVKIINVNDATKNKIETLLDDLVLEGIIYNTDCDSGEINSDNRKVERVFKTFEP